MIPHATPAPSMVQNPARFAAHMHAVPVGCRVALLGLPDDTGVRLNHGRPGAAHGPRAFREALARYGVFDPEGPHYPRVFDAGDVVPAGGHTIDALLETHRRIREAAAALVKLDLVPVAIGGGHDLTLPFVQGASNGVALQGIYFDAHLDVRDSVGSGMAFRELLSSGACSSVQVHGLNPLVNSVEHARWFAANGGRVRSLSHEAVTPRGGDLADDLPRSPFFASFDLDVLDASHAPGVSAINPAGWTVRQASAWVHAIGRSPSVRCFDIMELNPDHDQDARTARVAAHLFLTFLRGVGEREAGR